MCLYGGLVAIGVIVPYLRDGTAEYYKPVKCNGLTRLPSRVHRKLLQTVLQQVS